MASFNETLERMKALYTYGNEVNENKNVSTHSLEYHTVGADGKAYGIIRECNKYYIKTAPKNKEMVAEAYDYIGGFNNKSNYEYKSYSNAFKNIALKLASINEACEGKANISTLDPFKKNEFLVEGTDAMKNEIARQRQIMYNASMLMNEEAGIGATRKSSGVVMFDGKNPEAETGKKGDEGYTKKNAEPAYKGSKTNGVDKKVNPFTENPSAKNMNEACDAAGCDTEKEDWGSVGLGKGEDPEKVGWEMEGQTTVNEGEKCPKCGCEPCKCEKVNENEDWASQGLPATPGVGEADTDHNNDPFNKNINEEDFDDELNSDPEDGEFDDVDDIDAEKPEGEEEFEISADDDIPEDNIDAEEDLEGDEDLEDDELDVEDDFEDEDDFDTEDDFEDEDELDVEDDFEDEEPEEDFEDEDLPEEDFEDEDELDFEDEDDFDTEEPEEDFEDKEPEGEDFPEDDFDTEEPEMDELNEAKKRLMEKTVKSVTKKLLKEDELHVFGKHPGYQKKPMELPSTGEDKNQWGEDWNDESVYSEQPFGEKIGNGDPFNKLVDTITKSVMTKLMEGSKKKVR